MDDRPGTRAAGQPPDDVPGAEPQEEPSGASAPAAPEAASDDLVAGNGHARPTARSTGAPSPLVARRARSGDNTAFARLVEHYDPHLRAVAAGMIGEPGRVDAVLDGAYIKAYRAIPRLSRDATPDGWLCRATYLACIDDLRRTRRRGETRTEAPASDQPFPTGGATRATASTSTDTRTTDAVQRTLSALSLEERVALLLVDGEGFGHRTVAETLAMDQADVPRLLSTARAELLTVVDDDPLVALDQSDALRATVRALPVPEHGPEFWNRLGSRLLQERERPAVSTLDPLERLAARPPQDGTIPEDWTQGPVSELARQADLVRDAPDRRRTWLLVGVGVVVVAVVGFALWLGFSAAPDTRAMTAEQVADAMTDNLADAPFVVGRQTVSGATPSGRTERYRLLHASTGSFRLRGDDGSASFDAAEGTTRELNPVPGAAASMLVMNGLATGPPDPVGGNRYRFEDDLALVARTLINAGDAPVREAERSGRDVWLLSQPVDRADNGVDRIDVSVDRETSLPVEVARYRSDRLVERRVFDDLRVRSTVPPGSFVARTPREATVRTVDRGFRHVALPEVGRAVGYEPVTPAWLPDGFELAHVAVLRGTRPGAASAGVENPPDSDVISLAYRRGVQQVTVSTRRDGGPAVDWVDPFGTNQADEPEPVRLQAGRFHGTTVQEVAGDPVSPPHLWGRADGLVFTLAGDVRADELRRMAESLQ